MATRPGVNRDGVSTVDDLWPSHAIDDHLIKIMMHPHHSLLTLGPMSRLCSLTLVDPPRLLSPPTLLDSCALLSPCTLLGPCNLLGLRTLLALYTLLGPWNV